MTDPLRIRVDRPYANEEEFLDAEAWSITARSMLLIDIEPLPEGTALRCELRLANGRPIVVAEGFAVKHLDATATRPAGLVMRYKRMSSASSEFVARAVARGTGSRVGSSPTATAVLPEAASPPSKARAGHPRGPSRPSPANPPGRVSSNPPVRPSRAPALVPSSSPPPRPSRMPGRIPSSEPPPRPSRLPGRVASSEPPPRPSRLPGRPEPSSRPSANARPTSKAPRVGADRPNVAPAGRSVSVIPAARRNSTAPPPPPRRSSAQAEPSGAAPSGASRNSTAPSSSAGAPSSRLTGASRSSPPNGDSSRGASRATPTRSAGDAQSVTQAARDHDSAAMERLRKRAATKTISAPPDREAILARLKKGPSR